MALNNFNGWLLSTALLYLFRSDSSSNTSETASILSASNTTKIGSAIPVVLGRCMIKEPLVSYYGDFEAKIYTEEYGAHSWLNIRPAFIAYLLSIAVMIALPDTAFGANAGGAVVTTGSDGSAKRAAILNAVYGMLIWLLMEFIQNHLLRTTIQKGFKYYLGWQHVICWSGPDVGIRKIWMNVYDTKIEESSQAAIWEDGTATLANNPNGITININNENMFGGVDEGGGFVGDVRIYFGGNSQSKDSWMIQQMSADSVQEDLRGLTPKYPMYITAVIPKAYIGKQANIPSMWFEVVNYPNHLGFDKIGNDLNAAEAIYEILTNSDWGCNEDESYFDRDSLVVLGNICKNENLGVSIEIADSVDQAKTFIDKILNHINAVKYDSPVTGKLTFKAIRYDYDEATLDTFDTSNCISCDYTRLDWSETYSATIASFTDASNEYEISTVPDNDIANVKITNNIKEKQIDASYFTTAENAKTYAMTTQLSAGYPLASVTLEVNRCGFNKVIGDVAILSWPPYGISKMIVRITNVDYGSLASDTIKITAIEDVFSFGKTIYSFSNGVQWTTTAYSPADIEYYLFTEMPYEITKSKNSYLEAVAIQPSIYTSLWKIWRYKNSEYNVTAQSSKWSTGAYLVYEYQKSFSIDEVGIEISAIGASNNFDFIIDNINNSPDIYNNRTGTNLLFIDNEIMSYNSITKLPNGNYKVLGIIRGIYDTLPKTHASHSIVYLFDNSLNISGLLPLCSEGSTSNEQVEITTATVDKSANFVYNNIIHIDTVRRSEMPSVMANLKISADKGTLTEYTYDTISKYAGKLIFSYNERDKFITNGVISQEETQYNEQDIKEPDTVENVITVVYGASTIEHKYNNDLGISYLWSDFCTDFESLLQSYNTIKIYISSFDTAKSLYSYDRYEYDVNYVIPNIIGILELESDIQTYADSVVTESGVLIQESDYIPQTSYDFNNCSLIFIGQKDSTGIAIGQDGNTYNLSNIAYRVDGIDTEGKAVLHKEIVAEDYTVLNKFNQNINNYNVYYKYNGKSFILTTLAGE